MTINEVATLIGACATLVTALTGGIVKIIYALKTNQPEDNKDTSPHDS